MRAHSWQTALTWFYHRLMPGFLGLLALAGLWWLGQQMERGAYSLLMRGSAQPAQSPVSLILMDDASLIRLGPRFGPPPWPRRAYLEIFRRIAQAQPAVMALDSHFINLEQQDDARFFQALHAFPQFIGGLVYEEDHRNGWPAAASQSRLNTTAPDYYRLNLGVVNVSEDADGVIRSLQPFFTMRAGQAQPVRFPALSVAVAQAYLNRTQTGAQWTAQLRRDCLQLAAKDQPQGALSIPLDHPGTFRLRWTKLRNAGQPEYARSHEAIPLWRFFEPGAPPSLQNRIALIGSSATLYRDYHASPLANRHLGPDIHATAIDNLLRGESVQKAGMGVNLLILIALCAAIFTLRLRVRSFGQTLLYTLGAMIIFSWAVFQAMASAALWLDVATPLLFMVAAFVVGSAIRIFFKEKELAVMERNLAQLVDPEVFQEIRRLSHILKPGGQKLEITSMFVDIRNFTALAERLQPNEVTDLLNEFYEAIVTIVFGYHGTIDKFMGDGILIIFGAPLPNERHRAAALLAANDMLTVTAALAARWRQTQGIDTEIGISLNTGLAFVGFLGPTDKLEYTGVGDTVNICVRLQEHTKTFHTRLIMSEQTVQGQQGALWEKIPPDCYVELGEVPIRGREATIRVYTLQQAFLP